MDAVSGVASIIAIIGFASKGLEAIDDLKGFCKEFSPDATKEFLHDLQTTGNVLLDVEILSQKAKDVGLTRKIDYRASSLSIQVEDCARDLETWLKTALRIRRERGGRKKNLVPQFFNSFLTAISKSSRLSAREKLRLHQENMKTTLSLFGRHMDIANNITAHRNDVTVQQISEKVSVEAGEISKKVSSLCSSMSSSNDSIRAQNSEVSDKLDHMTDLLQRILSSNSSQRSHNGCNIGSTDPNEKHPHEKQLSTGPEPQTSPLVRHSTIHTDTSAANIDAEAEFETLHRATRALVDLVQQIHHPLIAEFLSTNHAWDTLEFQTQCLNMEPKMVTWRHTYDKAVGAQKIQSMKWTAASHLVSIKKQCAAEGLLDTLETVMAEVGVSKHKVELWHNIAAQTPNGRYGVNLDAIIPLNSEEQRKDRLTRINEWLLGILDAFPFFIELYKQIVPQQYRANIINSADDRDVFNYDRGALMESCSGSETVPLANKESEAARREILKFWFLDSAAMLQEDYASSHIPGSESEATARRIDEDEDEDNEEDFDALYEHSDVKEQNLDPVTASSKPLNLPNTSVFSRTNILSVMEPELDKSEESSRLWAIAEQTLMDYSAEPCKRLDAPVELGDLSETPASTKYIEWRRALCSPSFL